MKILPMLLTIFLLGCRDNGDKMSSGGDTPHSETPESPKKIYTIREAYESLDKLNQKEIEVSGNLMRDEDGDLYLIDRDNPDKSETHHPTKIAIPVQPLLLAINSSSQKITIIGTYQTGYRDGLSIINPVKSINIVKGLSANEKPLIDIH